MNAHHGQQEEAPPKQLGFINYNTVSEHVFTEENVSQPEPITSTPRPTKRFRFIDNSDVTSSSKNSTQVRRHVMQEYMRQKRYEARSRLSEGPETSSPEPKLKAGPNPRTRAQKRTDVVESSNSRRTKKTGDHKTSVLLKHDKLVSPVINQFRVLGRSDSGEGGSDFFFLGPGSFASLPDYWSETSNTSRLSTGSRDSWSSIASPAPGQALSQSPDPQSLLSAARTDPFDSLPMKLSSQDQELFDFYANVMPACSYGFERRSPHAHNWYLSVFIPQAMKGAVCFQNTILVHAANTQAWVKGLAETRLAIEHRARASEMLRVHFQRFPHDSSDAAISATLSAAALEDFDPRIERRRFAWMHWNAAMQKIRDRGGPAALVHNNNLQMLINWSDYIFSGYNAHGATFYFDHEYSPNHANAYEAEVIARREIAEQCEEFITFLRCVEHLALVHAGMKSSDARRFQPLRFSVFEPGQPLYELVASPNGPRYTETGQLKQIVSRLAALITINTAIWEYRHSTEMSEAFLQELVDNIRYNDLDKHISVEALIQILLSGSKDPMLIHTERPWFVGRMLKVAKRLSRPAFEKLNDVLLQFLYLGSDLQPVMLSWENDLRNEILKAPLVSYVLPCMQTGLPRGSGNANAGYEAGKGADLALIPFKLGTSG